MMISTRSKQPTLGDFAPQGAFTKTPPPAVPQNPDERVTFPGNPRVFTPQGWQPWTGAAPPTQEQINAPWQQATQTQGGFAQGPWQPWPGFASVGPQNTLSAFGGRGLASGRGHTGLPSGSRFGASSYGGLR